MIFKKITEKSGQSLLEIILAMAIFVVVISTISHFVLNAQYSATLSSEETQAIFLAKEGIEALRSIRDNDFYDLEVVEDYGVEISGNKWVIKNEPDIIDKFTRKITITEIDSDTWQIVSTISWQPLMGSETSVSLTDHLTTWRLSSNNINDWFALDNIRNDLNGDYVLISNLNENTNGYDEIVGVLANGGDGKGWNPIGSEANKFTGTFDGQNYSISDLFINRESTNHIGLFSYIDAGAEIKNINLLNVDITGNFYVGGLVGVSSGIISSCSSSGNVVGGNYYAGGLVGSNNGQIYYSFSEGNIVGGDVYVGGLAGINSNGGIISNSYSTADVAGVNDLGGLAGRNYEGSIKNSYAKGSVTRLSGENTRIAGFTGWNREGSIINSYSTGAVYYEGENDPTNRGFIGTITEGGIYADEGNFWDKETSGQDSTSGNATGKTTLEMKDITTFVDWSIILNENNFILATVAGHDSVAEGDEWFYVEEDLIPGIIEHQAPSDKYYIKFTSGNLENQVFVVTSTWSDETYPDSWFELADFTIEDIEIGDTLEIFSDWYIEDQKNYPRLKWEQELSTDLISFWRLEETSGTNVTDSYNNNHGTSSVNISGITSIGKIGNAFNFSGSKVTITEESSLQPEKISISFWIKPTSSALREIIIKGNAHNAHHWEFYQQSSWRMGVRFNSRNFDEITSAFLSSSEWKHVVITYDQDLASDNVKFYVNGDLHDSWNYSTPINYATDYDIVLGSYPDGAYSYQGHIDEIGLWGRVLTISEVKKIYNKGEGIFYNEIIE